MKRHLLIAAIFLLAGAVVNVAVAWGWGLVLNGSVLLPSPSELTTDQAAALWHRNAPPGGPIPPSTLSGWRTRGIAATTVFIWDHPPGVAFPSSRTRIRILLMHQTGWPKRCLYRVSFAPASVRETYRLLWPGFAVNTLFYAAAFYVLIFGPLALHRLSRRRRRLQRGRCPDCGYPMVGKSPVCTECGAELPGRTEAMT